MTDFFSSIAEQVVRGALTELVQAEDVLRLKQIQKNWDFYRGDQTHYLSDEDREFIQKNPSLKRDQVDDILSRPRVHLNYTRLVVDRYLDGCYGLEVNRTMEDAANQAVLEEIWKSNKMPLKMQSVQRITELEGLCAVIPRWKEKSRKIVYENYGAQHIIPVSAPDDPTNLYALILSWPVENKWGLVPDFQENTLPNGGGSWRYLWNALGGRGKGGTEEHGTQKYAEIWTADQVQAYLGRKLIHNADNPYGEIPFAFFRAAEDDGSFYGQTAINDVVAVNHVVNRLLSDLIEIIRIHGFSLLFIRGEMTEKLLVRPSSFLMTNQKDGDAKYLTPNSPIAEIQQFIDWFVSRLADVAQVPQATISGGTVEESGFALTIRWLPYTQMLARKRMLLKESEQDLARLSLLVAATHGLGGNPERSDLTVDFIDRKFVPKNAGEEMAAQEFKLSHDIITPIDMMREDNPDLDEDQLKAKFLENVQFNQQIREASARVGLGMDDIVSGLRAGEMKKRAEEKARALEEMEGEEEGEIEIE